MAKVEVLFCTYLINKWIDGQKREKNKGDQKKGKKRHMFRAVIPAEPFEF